MPRRQRRSVLTTIFLAVALGSISLLLGTAPVQPQEPTAAASTPVPGDSSAATLAPAGTPAVAAPAAPSATADADPAAVVVVAAITPTREAPFERRLPAPLRRTSFLDLRTWQWMALPMLLAVAFLAALLGTTIARRILRPAFARTRSTLDDTLLGAVRGPFLLAFTLMFFAGGLPVLALAEPVDAFLRGLLKGLGVLAISWTAVRLINVFAGGLESRLEREGRHRVAAIVPLGRRTAKIFLTVIAVVVLLQNVGLDVSGLLAGLGVGGIALALAAQKTIENIFGGVSVITDQPVRVGDLCRFRDGGTGTVEHIGLRSTRIRTPDRTLITIPNADFAQRELENLAARDRFRLNTVVGLSNETTPEQLRSVLAALRQALQGHPSVIADSVRVNLVGFGASSLNVELNAFVATTDQDQFNARREELLLMTMETIAGAGSALAVPSQTVHLTREPSNARR